MSTGQLVYFKTLLLQIWTNLSFDTVANVSIGEKMQRNFDVDTPSLSLNATQLHKRGFVSISHSPSTVINEINDAPKIPAFRNSR